MILWLGTLLKFYVVIEAYYVFWQMEQPILLFILIIKLLWLVLLSLGQVFLSPFYLFVIMVHGVIEPCGCQRITRALVLRGLLLKFKFWWLDQHLIPYMYWIKLSTTTKLRNY